MIPNNDCLVHVANLPIAAETELLYEIFNDYNVKNIILKKRPSGAFAFIEFDSPENAERAINDINYTKLDGNPIYLTLASVQNLRTINEGYGILYIDGLDENIEASQLHELFSNFGEVISCKVPMDGDKNKGFGYIQFMDVNDAEMAMEQLNGASINDKPIRIERYLRRSDAPRPLFVNRKNIINDNFRTVFVRGLPENINSNVQLVALFQPFGEVESVLLIKDKNAGFCRMKNHESAVIAMNSLNGSTLNGKTLSTCRGLEKEERIAYNEKHKYL